MSMTTKLSTGVSPPLFAQFFIALIVLVTAGLSDVAGIANAQTAPYQNIAGQADDIEVFVREGCPHCAKAETFLHSLNLEQPALRIRIRDIYRDPSALVRLEQLATSTHTGIVKVPAFYLNGQLLIGYTDEMTTGKLIRSELAQARAKNTPSGDNPDSSCEAVPTPSCTADNTKAEMTPGDFDLNFLGQQISLNQIGLPLFTVAMGLLDGFNPCSMWVLILMISLLAPMQDRTRMVVVAGTFIAVEGIAYFVFMAAWLNLFLLIGLSRMSEIVIASIAILAGAINLKEFLALWMGRFHYLFHKPPRPGIYARIRGVLQAENRFGGGNWHRGAGCFGADCGSFYALPDFLHFTPAY